MPPAIGEAIVKKYKKTGSPAVVDYKTYPGRTHRLVSQDGWEEIADYALEWATTHAADRAGREVGGGPAADPGEEPLRRRDTSVTRGVSTVEWCLGQVPAVGSGRPGVVRAPGLHRVSVQAAQGGDDVVVPAPRGGQHAGEDRDVVRHALVAHHARIDAGARAGHARTRRRRRAAGRTRR